MKQIFTAATVDEAKNKAAVEFGTEVEKITFTVLEEPKKGFFGKIKGEAKVEAEYEPETKVETVTEKTEAVEEKAEVQEEVKAEAEWSDTLQKKADCAKEYILNVIKAMGIEDTEIEVTKLENGALFEIKSEEFEKLIGKKGDILDSLQYLASLVCNRIDREYFRISTDCNGFRARRKTQLEELAKKIANNVKRSGHSSALEPMNPYERRIIHAAVSEIEGVTSQSKGEEPWRKVIISSTTPRKYDNRGGYKKKVEIWEGGANGLPLANATTTGYYLRKYVNKDISFASGSTVTKKHHNWILFRYAEVLLNYAEAMANAYGPDVAGDETCPMTAREAVNQVRNRSDIKMPAFPTGMSKEDFIKRLKNERRVELAFEGHRFWDIRRWKDLSKTADIYRVKIEKTGDNFNYAKLLHETRTITDNLYFYPISNTEKYKNPNLGQNPGW